MTLDIRVLTADDTPARNKLSNDAFGYPTNKSTTPSTHTEGLTHYGAFDKTGTLVGAITDLHHDQWWGGRKVAAADIAGVAVAPHARGRGVCHAMLRHMLSQSRERGAAVSCLYPTTASVYRSAGWEIVSTLQRVDLATMAIPLRKPHSSLTVRPGTPSDFSIMTDLYEQVAKEYNGMLTRRGALFTAGQNGSMPEGIDGVTLVFDRDDLVGYLSWQRGTGYRADSILTVHDALAITPEGADEIASSLAAWRSVAPTIRLRPLRSDASSRRLPLEVARESRCDHVMHRVVDAQQAVAERGWPSWVSGEVEFRLIDSFAPWNDGSWRLEIDAGRGVLTPISSPTELQLSANGFGALYSGASTPSEAAAAGLVSATDPIQYKRLGVLACGRPVSMLDYF